MSEFSLKIKLGSNAAMLTPRDVAAALNDVATALFAQPDDQETEQPIRDPNGNTVGRWRFVPPVYELNYDPDEEEA